LNRNLQKDSGKTLPPLSEALTCILRSNTHVINLATQAVAGSTKLGYRQYTETVSPQNGELDHNEQEQLFHHRVVHYQSLFLVQH